MGDIPVDFLNHVSMPKPVFVQYANVLECFSI